MVLNPCILNTTNDITDTDEDQAVGAMRLFPFSWTYFIYQTLGAMHLNSRVAVKVNPSIKFGVCL